MEQIASEILGPPVPASLLIEVSLHGNEQKWAEVPQLKRSPMYRDPCIEVVVYYGEIIRLIESRE